MAKPIQNLAGKQFGKLTVISYAGKTYKHLWSCLCTCGNQKTVAASNLTCGYTTSCGCVQRQKTSDISRKHGHSALKTATYSTWKSMIQRCTNPKYAQYALWGGRGIKICDRWDSYENFLADMGERPKGKTLDRINHNGDYSPDNCRWATPKEQSRNTRKNTLITFFGKTQCISEWSEELGFNEGVISSRIHRYGWSIERALTTPTRKIRESS